MDTVANRMLTWGDLVSHDDILDGEITICCAHDDVASYPIAADITQTAVCYMLPVPTQLGWDISVDAASKGEEQNCGCREQKNCAGHQDFCRAFCL